jgi:hypothetical protein
LVHGFRTWKVVKLKQACRLGKASPQLQGAS